MPTVTCAVTRIQGEGLELIEAARRLQTGESFVMATITRASGSTPRKVGSRMLVAPGGGIFGTIGGASAERLVIEAAVEALETGEIRRLELDLDDPRGEETGMICGGRIEVLIEPFGVEARLVLFGAGHVAKATAKLAVEVGFCIAVFDERPEWASAVRFPGAAIKTGRLEELAEGFKPRPSDFIAIMTHCHEDDYQVLRRVIRKGASYLGVIGSRKKSIEMRERLAGDGFSGEEIARIVCPIGYDIGSHTPEEVAVAVVAQLIQIRGERTAGRTHRFSGNERERRV